MVNADCIIINKGAYECPGYEKTLEGGLAFSLEEGLPMVSLGHDEVLTRHNYQHIWRDLCGQIFDFNLWCLSLAEAALELLMGEALDALNRGALNKLGYPRIGAFCREALGFGKSHGYELMRRAKMLSKLPLVREAYQKGLINRSSLRALLQVVTEETQERWVASAQSLTVRGIEDEVAQVLSEQKDPVTSAFSGEDDGFTSSGDFDGALRTGAHVTVRVPAALAARWDHAMRVFGKIEGAEVTGTGFLEALLAEYATLVKEVGGGDSGSGGGVSGGGDCSPAFLDASDGSGDVVADCSSLDTERKKMKALYRETRKALEEMTEYWKFVPWKPVAILVPEWMKGDPSCGGNPFKIAAKLKRMAGLQQKIAFYQGIMLMNLNNRNLNRDMMFVSLSHYCAERMGIGIATAYGRIRMVRLSLDYPEIKEGLFSGELTLEKVRLLCKVSREGARQMPDWIDYARRAPAHRLSAKIDEFIVKRDLHERECRRSPEDIRQELIEHAEIYVIDGVEYGPGEYDPVGFEAQMISRVRGCPEEMNLEQGNRFFEMCGMETGQDDRGPVSKTYAKRYLKEKGQGESEMGGKALSAPGHPSSTSLPGGLQAPGSRSRRLKFFLPRSLFPLWNLAAKVFIQRSGNNGSSPGSVGDFPEAGESSMSGDASPGLTEFLEALLEHFLSVWEKPEKRDFHFNVLKRDGWICQNPVCGSRVNLEGHHMRFRSRGGGNGLSNGTALCFTCHHGCTHTGSLVITGEAPDHITAVLGAQAREEDGWSPEVYCNGEKVLQSGGQAERALQEEQAERALREGQAEEAA